MSDTIIHIGLPKTGSTFIQKEVLENSDSIFYVGRPYTQEGLAFNMIQYCDGTIYDDTVVTSELDDLKRRSEGQKMVISDELLSGSPLYGFRNRTSIARRLQRHFPNARIVMCLRNQIDILASYFRQITEMGWNQSVLNEEYVHKAGRGLSFEYWRSGAEWDRSRRFVNHTSWISVGYFKYTALYDLYCDLFDDITVLLYEDLGEKEDDFFEAWAAIAGVEPQAIRKRSEDRVNTSGTQYKRKILSNRTRKLLENIELPGKDKLEKVLQTVLLPFFKDNVISDTYLENVIQESGIAKDNKKLIERKIARVQRYPNKYIVE